MRTLARWMPLCDHDGCRRRDPSQDAGTDLGLISAAQWYDYATPRDAVAVYLTVEGWRWTCEVHGSTDTRGKPWHRMDRLPHTVDHTTGWAQVLNSAWGTPIPCELPSPEFLQHPELMGTAVEIAPVISSVTASDDEPRLPEAWTPTSILDELPLGEEPPLEDWRDG